MVTLILIQWNEQTADWFDAASRYTGFHQKLSEKLLPHIGKRDSLVDLGCGVGLIDFALSSAISEITCVDESSEALTCLERLASARGVSNVRAIQADAYALEGRWDTVLAVFFGTFADHLNALLRLCNESVIAIVHADAQGLLGPKEYHPPKCNTVSQTKKELDAMGIRYTCEEHALEYGQPFASLSEAEVFVKAYSKNPPGVAIQKYLEETLVETGNAEYPYYLPNRKGFGMFQVRRDDHAFL